MDRRQEGSRYLERDAPEATQIGGPSPIPPTGRFSQEHDRTDRSGAAPRLSGAFRGGSRPREFPAPRYEIPCSRLSGTRRASPRTSKRIRPDGQAGGAQIRANSLYFPVDQGIWGGETGSRWTARSANQSASPLLVEWGREPSAKSPPFRGPLAERLRASQAETTTRLAPLRRSRASSPRAIEAVRYGNWGEAFAGASGVLHVADQVARGLGATRPSERAPANGESKVHPRLVSVSRFGRKSPRHPPRNKPVGAAPPQNGSGPSRNN